MSRKTPKHIRTKGIKNAANDSRFLTGVKIENTLHFPEKDGFQQETISLKQKYRKSWHRRGSSTVVGVTILKSDIPKLIKALKSYE